MRDRQEYYSCSCSMGMWRAKPDKDNKVYCPMCHSCENTMLAWDDVINDSKVKQKKGD